MRYVLAIAAVAALVSPASAILDDEKFEVRVTVDGLS